MIKIEQDESYVYITFEELERGLGKPMLSLQFLLPGLKRLLNPDKKPGGIIINQGKARYEFRKRS